MSAKKITFFLLFIFSFCTHALGPADERKAILLEHGLINCNNLFGEIQIFVCDDVALSKKVIVKSFDESMKDSYVNEKKILGYLQDVPGVIKLYKSIEAESFNRFFLVLEFSPNGDLSALIKNGKGLSEDRARPLFIQLIDTLSKVHDKKVAHRDIKLQNLILGLDGKVKVIDFGMSDDLRNGGMASLDRDVGTAYTMAPEVYHTALREHGQIDPYKVDVFAAAAVLATLVLGHPLYRHLDDYNVNYRFFRDHKTQTVLNKWRERSMEKDGNLPKLSTDFTDLIAWMMSPKPSERPTMKQVLEHPWVKMQKCPFCGF